MNVDFLNDPEFYLTCFYLFSYGLTAWFMGWGVSFLASLFIKILKKGV